ncbi:MAG TPA: hypothetical protein VJ179_03865 [Patescibacteria group bacterium]|nr:hypothetical protein [Patescibacteria group bacterium]
MHLDGIDEEKDHIRVWVGSLLAGLSLFFLFAFFFDLSYQPTPSSDKVAGTTVHTQKDEKVNTGGESGSTIQTGSASLSVSVSNTDSSSGNVNVSGTTQTQEEPQTTDSGEGQALEVTATDTEGVSTSTVTSADSGTGGYETQLDTSNLSDGPVDVEVKDVSGAVNSSEPTNLSGTTVGQTTYVKKTTKPKLQVDPIASPVTQSPIRITGVKDPQTAVYLNGQQIISRNADTVWQYSFVPQKGENTMTLYVVDEVGNKSDEVKLIFTYAPSTTTATVLMLRTPTVASSTHVDQNAWYPLRKIVLFWSKPDDVKGFSYSFTQKELEVPNETVMTTGTTVTVSAERDGTWYFHLRAQNSAGWGETRHFKVNIDTVAPKPFEVGVESIPSAGWEAFRAYFKAEDETSGIAKYAVKVDDRSFVVATSPYTLSFQNTGSHTLVVRAIDKAGNKTISLQKIQVTGTAAEVKTPVLVEKIAEANVAQNEEGVVSQGEPVALTGKGPANATILLFIYSKPIVAFIRTDEEGNWTYVIEQELPEGSHTIYTTAIDAEGYVSPRVKLLSFDVQAASAVPGRDEQVRIVRSVEGISDFLKGPGMIVGGLLLVVFVWFGVKTVLQRVPPGDKHLQS